MRTPALTTVASLGAALAALSYATPARALGPVDIEIGARVGVATDPSSNLPTNPYGFGFGGRAGVSIFGLYGGISGMYYLGTSSTPQGIPAVAGGATTAHTAMYGLEVGYTLPIPVVKIRPQVGIGDSIIGMSGGLADGPATPSGVSASNLYLEPGVLVFVPIRVMFIGADVNALILPSASGITPIRNGPGEEAGGSGKTYASLSVHGQVEGRSCKRGLRRKEGGEGYITPSYGRWRPLRVERRLM